MKKIIAAAFALFLGSMARAATSDNIIIKVTPSGTKGVSIDATEWDLGTKALNAQNILSSATINVTNTGTISSSWALKVSPVATSWTPTSGSGADAYHLQAIFNAAAPAAGDFDIISDDLTASDKTCTASDFAGDQSCVNVPPSDARKLWLNLDMPTSSSSESQQQISLVVTAI